MSKIVNISEDKLKRALREIFKEEVLNGPDPTNQNPLDPIDTQRYDQIHNVVNDQETIDTPDGNMSIENPELP